MMSRLDEKGFERLVRDALEVLPESFAERLENVEVVVEDEPDARLLHAMGIGPGGTLLGLYQGVPLPRRGHHYGNVLPDRIVIYMGPILRMRQPPGGLPELVREVVLHELGHYFGLSDEELSRLEGR